MSSTAARKQPNQNGYSQKKKKQTTVFKDVLEKEILGLGSKISIRI
jgi:hypothetical protein